MDSSDVTVISVTALAVALAEGRDSDELTLLGALFTQLGDTFATMSIQRAKTEAKQNPP